MNRNIATLAAGFALGLTGLSANASHIAGLSLFDGQDFTFDGTTYGGGSAFTASAIDFSYVADIDQTNAGPLSANFTETGVAFFSSFQQPLGTPVSAATTGLNNGYRMYGVFTAAGTIVPGAGFPLGGVDGEFSAFNLTIYIDPNEDSATIAPTAGGANNTTSVSNTGDDVAILSGVLSVGGFHVFTGLANGDFDVLFDVTSYDASVWGGAAFGGDVNGDGDFLDAGEAVTTGDINGVNTSIVGLGAPATVFGDKTDVVIRGSGNIAFRTVPVPGVLGLMGAGLLGLGLVNRRRN